MGKQDGSDAIPRSTMFRATKILEIKAYTMRVVQELKPQDFKQRLTYCEWFLELTDNGNNMEILDKIPFT